MKSILEVVRDLIKPYIDKNASNIAPVEDSPVENPYYAGDQLIYKGVLYNVTSNISIGDDLDIGNNISVAPKINNSIKSKLSSYSLDPTVWDTAPTANSTKPVTSGGVKTELDKKLSTYANGTSSWDTSPTASSTKPVTSGGVYTGLSGKAPTNHASTTTTYGVGNASNYGHVKLNDSYTSSGGAASASVGASSKAVVDGYNALNGNKTNQSVIAPRQANNIAIQKYEVGKQFIYNNILYTATAEIAKNGTINPGGNCSTSEDIVSQLTPKKLGMTSGYTFNKNFVYQIGRLVNISCNLLAPAGVNYGTYLAIAFAPVAPIEEVLGTALIIYGAHTYATTVKITTDRTIYILAHYDAYQAAGGNLCDVSFDICYVSA